jgi:hypothetical protein
MKLMSPRIHGFIDYAIVALFALAPTLFGFGGFVAGLCYLLAAMQFGMSIMTAYPLGAIKAIPFTIHGALEATLVVGLVVAPWLLGFSHVANARNFFLVAGAMTAALWFVTDYKAASYRTSRSTSIIDDHRTYA